MSIRLMSAAWAVRLSDSDKLILLALADWSNDDGVCWPSVAQLASKSSKSERTVQAALKSLETAGHIKRDQKPGKGCTYLIHPRSDCAPAATAPPQQSRPAAAAPTPAAAAPNTSITHQASTEATPPTKRRASKPQIAPFRMPSDWRPIRFTAGTVARAIIDRRGIEWGRAALESFRNWAANADDKPGIGRKHDWQAAWSKWVIEQDRRDGNHGTLQPHPKSGIRGSRPSPALDLARRGAAEEQAERIGGDEEADWRAWAAVPAIGSS